MANDIVGGSKGTEVSKFNYYEAIAQNPQIFFMRVAEHFCNKLKDNGEKIDYVSFLQIAPLSNDPEGILKSLDYEIIPSMLTEFPLSGFGYLMEEYSGISDKKDTVFKFTKYTKSPTFISIVNNMSINNESIIFRQNSCVMAANKEDATILLNKIYEKARENSVKAKVVDYAGNPLSEFRKMSWDNIHLPNNMGQDIKDSIMTFFKSEKDYKENDLDWRRGMILAGPPGSGKTSVCRAICSDPSIKYPVIYVDFSGGNDPNEILAITMDTISRMVPTIVVFEDAEYIIEGGGLIRSGFLSMLDGFMTASGVFSILTLNMPEKLDPALSNRPSRFDLLFPFTSPGVEQIEKILVGKLGKKVKNISKKEIKELSEKMKGLSAASCQEVVVSALLYSVTKKKELCAEFLFNSIKTAKKHAKIALEGIEAMERGRMGFDGNDDCDYCGGH